LNFLKKTIESINTRTLHPYYLFVVDNGSTDGTDSYLRSAKVNGKIFDCLLLPENIGQSRALNKLFEHMESWQQKRPMSDFFLTTNDDLLPPNLRPCWLERMLDIYQRHEPDGLGALSMRIQRTARADINEDNEVFYWNKGIPSVFRLMRRSDMRKLGDRPFGRLMKWDSNSTADRFKLYLKKRYGFTTHIYADHLGWCENRGYDETNKSYFTYAENKEKIHEEKPYPDIDPETNEPIKVNHYCDQEEHRKRLEYKAKILGEIKPPEVSIIVLTCKRYDGLQRVLQSIKAHTGETPHELLVVADNDDTDAYQYCLENNIDCLLSSTRRDFTLQANLGVYACRTPYFVILADDMEIVQDKWLGDALEMFKERFKDDVGIMCFQDGIQNGRIFTSGMSSKKFVQFAGGHMYYPKYIHFGGDNELSAWTKELGLYHYAESIKVEHYHPTHKDPEKINPSDETYQVSNRFFHQDQILKKARKANMENLKIAKNNYDFKE
jgi:glycosyltransferase involved in cell wall biosynthesis